MGILGAIAVSIILKWDLTIMDCATWAADRDSINHYNPDLFPVFVNP
jgi:hypothetical protein